MSDQILQINLANASSTINDALSHSFQQNSVLWILFTLGLGGLLTAALKYIFEQTLPEWRRRREKRIALQRYSYPLTYSANFLFLAMGPLIGSISLRRKLAEFGRKASEDVNLKDDYYPLSILYTFAFFFGWCRILEREAFVELTELSGRGPDLDMSDTFLREYGYVGEGFYPRTKSGIWVFFDKQLFTGSQFEWMYQILFSRILSNKPFIYRKLPEDKNTDDDFYADLKIPRLITTSIGDLMINENKDSKEVLNLFEFTEIYKKNPDLRKSLCYFTDILGASEGSTGKKKVEFLVGFYLSLRDFICFQYSIYNRKKDLLNNFIESSAERIKSWNLKLPLLEDDLYYVRRHAYFTRLDYLKSLWLLPYRPVSDDDRRPKWHYLLAPMPFLGVIVLRVKTSRAIRRARKEKKEENVNKTQEA